MLLLKVDCDCALLHKVDSPSIRRRYYEENINCVVAGVGNWLGCRSTGFGWFLPRLIYEEYRSFAML